MNFNILNNKFLYILLLWIIPAGCYAQQATVVWKTGSLSTIGGLSPTVLGAPKIVRDGGRSALWFDGIDDGINLSKNPVEGWKAFTVEALFKPDSDGPVEPRFLHFEDSLGNRGTLEIRITKEGRWYLDAFLKNGKTGAGFALIDPLLLHEPGKWYWVALTYDGKQMRSYVNGIPEHEGELDFPVSVAGNISLGVRLNKVNWFKGAVSEVRFSPAALEGVGLQRVN